MVMTGVVVIVAVFGCRCFLLIGLHTCFVERFLKTAFETLHVNGNTVVFGGLWGDAVTDVGSAVLANHDIWLNQRKV